MFNEIGASESTPKTPFKFNLQLFGDGDPIPEPTPEPTPTDPAPTDPTPEPGNDPIPELYSIKVQGQEKQVPMDELIKLAQMGDDYTRKTQQLGVLKELGDLMQQAGYDPANELQNLRLQMAQQENPNLTQEDFELKQTVDMLLRDKMLTEQEKVLSDRPYFKDWEDSIKSVADTHGADYETVYAVKLMDEFPNILQKWEEEKKTIAENAVKEYLAKKGQPIGVTESGDGATPVVETKAPKTFADARANAMEILKQTIQGGS